MGGLGTDGGGYIGVLGESGIKSFSRPEGGDDGGVGVDEDCRMGCPCKGVVGLNKEVSGDRGGRLREEGMGE